MATQRRNILCWSRCLQFESLELRQMLAADTDVSIGSFDEESTNAFSSLSSSPLLVDTSTYDDQTLSLESTIAAITIPRGRPALNASESTFVADNGNLLRGPFASTEWGNPPPLSAIQSIKNFGANAIHLYGEVFDPNYVSGVPGSGQAPGYAVNRIDQMVQMTRSEGLYLVLTIGNGGNNGSFNHDYVMDFWNLYAARYKDETHVLFEIQNEPHAWSAPYPQAALDMEAEAYTLIRSLAPDTPILLFSFAVLGSGPNAVGDIQDVSAAANIDWSNAAVAFHGYAGHESTTQSVEHILNAGYPVFMTEFTASDWGTDTDVLDVEMVSELERLEISWLTFQHIPPNFIGTSYNNPAAMRDVADRAGISWTPDFGTWPLPRGVYGNNGEARATTGLSGTLRIEAEHFDTGAQGVAYSDSDLVNQGNQFRLDVGVDISRTVDTGGGHNITSTVTGEWLEYTIFVTEPGFHDLRLRVASDTGGSVRLLFDGEDKTGEWVVPSTGGAQIWTTITKQAFLNYGLQKIRVEIASGGFNLNWLEISPAASGALANGIYKFLNRNSALAAEADTVNRVVVQSNYTGANTERWTVTHRGAGQYSITSVANNWSWNTFYDNNGEPVTLANWGYDGAADRRFMIVPESDGYFSIRVVDGGLGVEIDGASLTDGAAVQHSEYQDTAHQHWAIMGPNGPAFPTNLAAALGDPADLPGDYNSDGAVNGRDFLVWQRSYGSSVAPGTNADGNNDGVVDAADRQIWSQSYGHQQGESWNSLSWNNVLGALSYNIKRSDSEGGPYLTIASGITGTSFADTGLSTGTAYYYVVTAVTQTGESLISAEASPSLMHAHYMFDEASGTPTADATGNGWNATLVNGALRTAGISGNAVDLDGSNDYVNLPTAIVDGLTEATIATWVRLDALSDWARLFDFGTGTSNYMFLAPDSGSTGRPVFAITTSGGGGEQRINSNITMATGVWTHVAVTLNGSVGVLYINGVEVGRNNSMTLTPDSLGATTQNYIGKSQYTWDAYLNGRVDDFRIYDDALTGSQIAELAGASPISDLIAASSADDASALELAMPDSFWLSLEEFDHLAEPTNSWTGKLIDQDLLFDGIQEPMPLVLAMSTNDYVEWSHQGISQEHEDWSTDTLDEAFGVLETKGITELL
jgi:endoglucanase